MEDVLDGTVGTEVDDMFATSEIAVPAAEPDAHQGTIEGVTLDHLNNEKQTAIIRIALKSRNAPLDVTLDVFVPKGFEEDIKIDANELPEEEGNKQQTSYRLGIANSDGTATLQELRALAKAAGRNGRELGCVVPANLDEFVENHNKLLTGLEVIFLRRPRGGDDVAFKNQLNVKRIVAADTAETNPKSIKKYRKVWEG